MDGRPQPANAIELAELRQKLGHINRAISALEALQEFEVTAPSALPANKAHNVVSIDCFRGKSQGVAKAAQCPPATSVEG